MENNERWGGNSTSALRCNALHHSVVDCLPIIAGPIMFYSLLIIYMHMYTVLLEPGIEYSVPLEPGNYIKKKKKLQARQ